VRRKGLFLYLLTILSWMAFALLSYFRLSRWGAVAGLALLAALAFLLPRGSKAALLQVFSLLFFLVACVSIPVLGKEFQGRVPNLLAGGFATLCIMAGYGLLMGTRFPSQYLEQDYPRSMQGSPVLQYAYLTLTLVWSAIFLAGLVLNLVSMLVLGGEDSLRFSSLASSALFGSGLVATPLLLAVLPRRRERSLLGRGSFGAGWEPPPLTPGEEQGKNEYQVAVVGAGMGGLACAALLARAGMKVLVAEKARFVGGYCQTYDWQGFPLNSGPAILLGGTEGGALKALLQRLDLDGLLHLRRLDWGMVDGKTALRLGLGPEQDLEKLKKKFPGSQEGLDRLWSDLYRFRGELMDRADYLSPPLPVSIEEYHEQFVRHPVASRWQNMTFQEMLEEYLPDEDLCSMLGKLAAILGGRRETFPAFEGARLLTALFLDGIHHPVHHYSRLCQELANRVRQWGGEVRTSCGAEEVLVKEKSSAAVPIGLRLSDGSQARCQVVVLDVDPRNAVGTLLPPSRLGGDFLRGLERLQPSPSAYVLHLVFHEDLRIPDRVFLFPARTRRVRTGNTYLEVDSIILAKERPLRADRTGCILMARVNVPPACYPAFEEEGGAGELGAELALLVKEEIASVLPPVKKAAKEFFTLPTHFNRMTSNLQGAAFGFAPLSAQWYYRLPGPRLPLPNLYLVGGWSRYGAGVEGAVLSGAVVARELCGESPRLSAVGSPSPKKAAGAEESRGAEGRRRFRIRRRREPGEEPAEETSE